MGAKVRIILVAVAVFLLAAVLVWLGILENKKKGGKPPAGSAEQLAQARKAKAKKAQAKRNAIEDEINEILKANPDEDEPDLDDNEDDEKETEQKA